METIASRRAYSIDVLRGMAILLMLVANFSPYTGLPAFMYHAQTPPPSKVFNPNVPGITWVDLIFPFFIFSMGAAIPLALTKKLQNGTSAANVISGVLKRGMLLVGFAIFVYHANPARMDNMPEALSSFLGIVFFILMFAVWGKFPWRLSKYTNILIKLFGIFITAGLFVFIKYKDGYDFTVFRSDIILLVLSNLAVCGGICWVLSRHSIILRVMVLIVFMAIRLANSVQDGWVHHLASQSIIPFFDGILKSAAGQGKLTSFRWLYDFSWFFRWGFMQYMFIIIPATIVGDIILKWMSDKGQNESMGWSGFVNFMTLLLMFFFTLSTLIGLQGRWIVSTVVITVILSIAGFFLLRKPKTCDERLIFLLYRWGVFWLLLGLLFEPYENGIKKDPSTMSFYFVTSGLAIFCLIGFTIILNRFGMQKHLQLFILNGQNPMIAYVAAPNVLFPVLALTGLKNNYYSVCAENPWGGFAAAIFLMLAAGFAVTRISSSKVYLRT